jgi:hypothetical protein
MGFGMMVPATQEEEMELASEMVSRRNWGRYLPPEYDTDDIEMTGTVRDSGM